MRILYVVRTFQFAGGIERTLTDKANWLSSHGHEVMFVIYKQDGEPYFLLNKDIKLYNLNCSVFTLYKYPLYTRLYHYNKLRRIFRERLKHILGDFHPDVIIPVIPNAEDFLWDIMKVASGIKVVVESHVAYDYLLYGKSFTDRLLFLLYSPFRAIGKSDLLIALTEHDAVSWRGHHLKNVLVLPNPVTCYPDDINLIPKVEGRIISVARLSEQKRLDRLIEAFARISDRYPDWFIDIYGDGNLRDTLETLIKEKNLIGRINIFQSVRDIMKEYQRSQFFVLSSDYEGFGLVLIEAMACGLPVVATDCPHGPSEIIDNGVTGLLTKLDVQDLADKMEWMIIHQEERKIMGVKAHEAAAVYRKDVIMKKWESAYKLESI